MKLYSGYTSIAIAATIIFLGTDLQVYGRNLRPQDVTLGDRHRVLAKSKQCKESCSGSANSNNCDPNGCSRCELVGGVARHCVPDCGEKCENDMQCDYAGQCSKCINGKCTATAEPLPQLHQCKEPCSANSNCDPNDCSLCKLVGSVARLCMPDCGEKCENDMQCAYAGQCSKCINGKCTAQPFTQLHSQGSFERGPYYVPFGHKESTIDVGGMCHPGCKREKAVVTSRNKDVVACGKFNVRYHDAHAAKWKNPNNPKDCTLNIPYCEHAWDKSKCSYKIYEKCEPQ